MLYWATPGNSPSDDPGNPTFGTAFKEFLGTIGGGATGWGQFIISQIDIHLAASALSVGGVPYDQAAANREFIPYRVFNNAAALPVYLVRKSTSGIDGVILPADMVVDRMSSPLAGDPFPAVLSSTYQLDLSGLPGFDPATNFTGSGRVAVVSDLHRHDENPKGFPAYVVERREANIVVRHRPAPALSGNQPLEQKWLLPGAVPPADVLAATIPADSILLDLLKGQFEIPGQPIGLPAFQLFVPDRPIEYLSELLLVSPFCNMYVHRHVLDGSPDPSGPDRRQRRVGHRSESLPAVADVQRATRAADPSESRCAELGAGQQSLP